MPDSSDGYEVNIGNRARKFIRRHPDLKAQWDNEILQSLVARPLLGPRITHMKGNLHCSRRWKTGTFRILYDVYNDDRFVDVFDADIRGDIY